MKSAKLFCTSTFFFFLCLILTFEYSGNAFMELKAKFGRSKSEISPFSAVCQWPSNSFALGRFLLLCLIKNLQFIQEQMFTFILEPKRTWQCFRRVWWTFILVQRTTRIISNSHGNCPHCVHVAIKIHSLAAIFVLKISMNFTPIWTICISLPRFSSVALKSKLNLTLDHSMNSASEFKKNKC